MFPPRAIALLALHLTSLTLAARLHERVSGAPATGSSVFTSGSTTLASGSAGSAAGGGEAVAEVAAPIVPSKITPAHGSICGGGPATVSGPYENIRGIFFGNAECANRLGLTCNEVPPLVAAAGEELLKSGAVFASAGTQAETATQVPVSVLVAQQGEDGKLSEQRVTVGSYNYAPAQTPRLHGFSPSDGVGGQILQLEGEGINSADSEVFLRRIDATGLDKDPKHVRDLPCAKVAGASVNSFNPSPNTVECTLPSAPAGDAEVLVRTKTGFACYFNVIEKHPAAPKQIVATRVGKDQWVQKPVSHKAAASDLAKKMPSTLNLATAGVLVPAAPFNFDLKLFAVVNNAGSVPSARTVGSLGGGSLIRVVGQGFSDADEVKLCGQVCHKKPISPATEAEQFAPFLDPTSHKLSTFVRIEKKRFFEGRDAQSVFCEVPAFSRQQGSVRPGVAVEAGKRGGGRRGDKGKKEAGRKEGAKKSKKQPLLKIAPDRASDEFDSEASFPPALCDVEVRRLVDGGGSIHGIVYNYGKPPLFKATLEDAFAYDVRSTPVLQDAVRLSKSELRVTIGECEFCANTRPEVSYDGTRCDKVKKVEKQKSIEFTATCPGLFAKPGTVRVKFGNYGYAVEAGRNVGTFLTHLGVKDRAVRASTTFEKIESYAGRPCAKETESTDCPMTGWRCCVDADEVAKNAGKDRTKTPVFHRGTCQVQCLA